MNTTPRLKKVNREAEPRTPTSLPRDRSYKTKRDGIRKPEQKSGSKSKSKSKSKSNSRVRDLTPDQDDENEDEIPVLQPVATQPLSDSRSREAIKTMRKLSLQLSSLGGVKALEEFLQKRSIEEVAFVNELRNQFSVEKSSPVARSTMHEYDKFFVHLAKGNLVYVLRPFDIFEGNKSYNRHKTLGIVREGTSSPPLKYAISGHLHSTETHEMLLNSKFWTEEVIKWAEEHGHRFQKGPWDKHHKKPDGFYGASHVEPRLMLWLACYMVNKHLKTAEMETWNERKFISVIWKLKKVKNLSAEILISHSNKKPCGSCLAFQEAIQIYTGIRFTISSMPNLGELVMHKDKAGNNQVPLFAEVNEQNGDDDQGDHDSTDDHDDDDDDDDDEGNGNNTLQNPIWLDSPPRSSSNLRVVLRSRLATTTTTTTTTTVESSSKREDPFGTLAKKKAKEMKLKSKKQRQQRN